MLAIVAGGVAGFVCFVGLTLLLYRRIFDPRIRLTSHRTDIAILIILWVQLVLGLITLPFSLAARRWQRDADPGRLGAAHRHASASAAPKAWSACAWPYMVHMVLGMTIFLLFPFSRLVHVWSGFATVGLPVPPVPGGAQPAPERAGRPQPAAPARRRRLTESRT